MPELGVRLRGSLCFNVRAGGTGRPVYGGCVCVGVQYGVYPEGHVAAQVQWYSLQSWGGHIVLCVRGFQGDCSMFVQRNLCALRRFLGSKPD